MSLRDLTANDTNPNSLASRARRKRWVMFTDAFPGLESMAVLDLGGTEAFWLGAPTRPKRITLLNPVSEPLADPSAAAWIRPVAGDACDPPAEVADHYDLVYSNSTIEHVGGHARRQQFADVVRARAPRSWVQTPNRYFPIEPHWMLPFGQQIPPRFRAEAVRRWPLRPSGFPSGDGGKALAEILDIELLSRTDLAWYFPEATILNERVGGLTKSLIAVRGAAA
jgi:hypothetical protein